MSRVSGIKLVSCHMCHIKTLLPGPPCLASLRAPHGRVACVGVVERGSSVAASGSIVTVPQLMTNWDALSSLSAMALVWLSDRKCGPALEFPIKAHPCRENENDCRQSML